jgi:hypothetical protein
MQAVEFDVTGNGTVPVPRDEAERLAELLLRAMSRWKNAADVAGEIDAALEGKRNDVVLDAAGRMAVLDALKWSYSVGPALRELRTAISEAPN